MHALVNTSATTGVVQIIVSGHQFSKSFDLHEGESALVGQAAGCQLRIEDRAIAPHQCLVELRAGTLMLHNWSEEGSTTVNGNVVNEEVVLKSNDKVEFGNYRIRFQQEASEPDSVSTQEQLRVEQSDVAKVESVEDATIAFLHSEIDFLQRELEQRDATIAQAELTTATPVNREELATPGNRLNELLTELEVADARLLCLTDELRLLEELRAAESEERRQVTVWVNEIEAMIAKREEERHAEMDVLRTHLNREKAERLVQQRRADDRAHGTEAIKDTLKELRNEHESLREKFMEISEINNKLQQECDTLRELTTEAAMEKRIHEVLRAERLQLAQERASISRREHDLSKRLREAELQLAVTRPAQNVAVKTQDFHEEIHESFEEEPEYPTPTLGERLRDLWNSLDGPTDQD